MNVFLLNFAQGFLKLFDLFQRTIKLFSKTTISLAIRKYSAGNPQNPPTTENRAVNLILRDFTLAKTDLEFSREDHFQGLRGAVIPLMGPQQSHDRGPGGKVPESSEDLVH